MILKDKTILIMGIRNKWSIAYGAAKAASEQGAKLCFTFMGEDNRGKIEELISEFDGAKAYECDVSVDTEIERLFNEVKADFGKLDGIVHCIAHANTEDLHNDFIETSKDGFAHANDVSAYTLVAVSRYAKNMGMLNENASIVALTYYGPTKVLPGYNVMGVAKAALEASIRYLAENLGKDGIRVNAISAGPIKTLSSKGIKDFGSILNVVEERAPLKRNVDKEEVGNAVSFMLSPMSSAITGQIIFADCGYNIMGC
jgi:enoyl-[acyl-carrier protein] reductase I